MPQIESTGIRLAAPGHQSVCKLLKLVAFIHLSDNVNMTTEITLHMC